MPPVVAERAFTIEADGGGGGGVAPWLAIVAVIVALTAGLAAGRLIAGRPEA